MSTAVLIEDLPDKYAMQQRSKITKANSEVVDSDCLDVYHELPGSE